MRTFDLTRPVLKLKKPVAEPEPAPPVAVQEPVPAAPQTPADRARRPTRGSIKFLASLGLPLFERMHREGVFVPMARGINDDVLDRIDPVHHHRARRALSTIAYSLSYQEALSAKGARRRSLDDNDAGPIWTKRREMTPGDLGLEARP